MASTQFVYTTTLRLRKASLSADMLRLLRNAILLTCYLGCAAFSAEGRNYVIPPCGTTDNH